MCTVRERREAALDALRMRHAKEVDILRAERDACEQAGRYSKEIWDRYEADLAEALDRFYAEAAPIWRKYDEEVASE